MERPTIIDATGICATTIILENPPSNLGGISGEQKNHFAFCGAVGYAAKGIIRRNEAE